MDRRRHLQQQRNPLIGPTLVLGAHAQPDVWQRTHRAEPISRKPFSHVLWSLRQQHECVLWCERHDRHHFLAPLVWNRLQEEVAPAADKDAPWLLPLQRVFEGGLAPRRRTEVAAKLLHVPLGVAVAAALGHLRAAHPRIIAGLGPLYFRPVAHQCFPWPKASRAAARLRLNSAVTLAADSFGSVE